MVKPLMIPFTVSLTPEEAQELLEWSRDCIRSFDIVLPPDDCPHIWQAMDRLVAALSSGGRNNCN